MRRILLLFVSCVMALSMSAAELNIYASGLKAGGMGADKKVQVDYLLNAPATTLEIHVLNADNSVALNVPLTDAALLTKGRHTVAVDVSTLTVGSYNWEIKAAAATTEAMAEVTDAESGQYSYYFPMGIDVDRNPQSPFFGRIYVTEGVDGGSDGSTERAKTLTHGVYIYDPLLQDVTSQGVTGYQGGVKWRNVLAGDTGPKRLAVAEDGSVFIADNNGGSESAAATSGVWMMDPADPKADFKEVLATASRKTTYTAIASVEVTGTGDERVMYVLDNIAVGTGAFIKFPIGNAASPFAAAGDTLVATKDIGMANAYCTVKADGRGGFWITQSRWGADNYPALMHLNSKLECDLTSDKTLLPFTNNISYRGSLGLSADKTKLAVGSDKKGVVFSIVYDAETGVPTLTRLYETAELGGNIDGIAFDAADNLYVASASSERFYAFATPKAANEYVTPAAMPIVVTDAVVAVTGVKMDKETADLRAGETLQLTATVEPEGASNKSVSWTSSDESVATVSGEGVVTGLKAGDVTITATTAEGGFTATCTVKVASMPVESVSLNSDEETIYVGETVKLEATVMPANATDKSVSWTSSDTLVATVSAEGVVTAVAVGEATVTVTTTDGGKTAVCTITVPEAPYPNIYAYGLKLESATDGVTVGFNLNAPATEVTVLAYDAEQNEYVVATVAGAKAEYQTTQLDLTNLPEGEYTWAVKAEAELVAEDEPVLVKQYATNAYNLPRGVAIDKNPESPFFGNVYVSEGGGTVETSGVYIYDPKLNGGDKLYGSDWTAEHASPMRMAVGEDGLVFVADWTDSQPNVHVIDPANLDSNKLVFGGTYEEGIAMAENGDKIHGEMSGIYVKGTGEDRYLYTFDADLGQAILRYKIGNMTEPYAKKPGKTIYMSNENYLQNGNSAILMDAYEGWWISQDRANDNATIPALIHVTKDGVCNFNSAGMLGGRTRGTMAFNEDQTYCVTASDNSLRVWAVTWTDSVPALELEQQMTTTFGSQQSSTCYDIAIDPALNVYTSGNGKPLHVWALIKDENVCTTPAPQAMKFHVTGTGLDNIEAGRMLKKGVYSVTGQYLGETADLLPQGIYIVNGQKTVK